MLGWVSMLLPTRLPPMTAPALIPARVSYSCHGCQTVIFSLSHFHTHQSAFRCEEALAPPPLLINNS